MTSASPTVSGRRIRLRPPGATARLVVAVILVSLVLDSATASATATATASATASATSATTTSTTTTSTGSASLPPLASLVLVVLAPSYAVKAQGPLDANSFAASAPDPTEAAAALASIGASSSTYEREWADNTGKDGVQDVLVRFPSAATATVFLETMDQSLNAGEIESSGPLASVPGAHMVTYFAVSKEQGVGEAITMQTGVYVDMLAFFSASAQNAHPITPEDAAAVAKEQQAALVAPAPPSPVKRATTTRSTGSSHGSVTPWVVLVVVLLGLSALAALMRRRRRATENRPAPRHAARSS